MLDVDKSGRINKDEFTEDRASDVGALGLIGGFQDYKHYSQYDAWVTIIATISIGGCYFEIIMPTTISI